MFGIDPIAMTTRPKSFPLNPLIATTWLATVAAAFYLGTFRPFSGDPEPAASAESIAADSGSPRVDRPVFVEDPDSGPDVFPAETRTQEEGVLAGIQTPATRGAELSSVELVRRALGEGDRIARFGYILEALEKLTPENAHEVAEMIESEAGGGPGRFQSMALLMQAWGRVDAPAALAFANEMGGFRGSRMMAASAMNAWGRDDPVAAMDYIQQQGLTIDSPEFSGLLSGWAESDPYSATAYLSQLPNTPERRNAVETVARTLARSDAGEAIRWAETLSDPQLRVEATQEVASALGAIDPGAAASFLERQPEAVAASAAEGLASNWARDNPLETAEWIDSLPAGQTRANAMSGLVAGWTRQDPAAVGNYLNQFESSPDIDPALDQYARRVGRADPATAITYSMSITDPELRARSTAELGRVWYQQDPEGARQFVESEVDDPRVRAAILGGN